MQYVIPAAEAAEELAVDNKVLAGFIINSTATGAGIGVLVSVPSFALMVGVSALEMLVAGVQAYVFALLTSLYINDAVHLHDHH